MGNRTVANILLKQMEIVKIFLLLVCSGSDFALFVALMISTSLNGIAYINPSVNSDNDY